jgi:hypothetical protein
VSPARTFTLPQIAEIAAIDYRTLHNWQKRGMLRASHQTATGSGTTNRFTPTDALQVLILAELRRSGVEVKILESVADDVWDVAEKVDPDHQLLIVSHGSVSLSSDEDFGAHVADERPAVVLNIQGARRALEGLPTAA